MGTKKLSEYAMTKKELANVAGYTYRRIHDIDTELPENEKLFVPMADGSGKYDLSLFVQRWVKFNLHRQASHVDDLESVKAKHEIIKTQKTELEVARIRGELVDVQDVRRLWANIANTVTQSMLHFAGRTAPMLRMIDSVETIAEILDTEIRKTLEGISETPLPDYAAGKEEEGENEEV